MQFENGKITSKQLMIAVIAFIQGSAFLTSFLASVAKQDIWLVVLLGSSVFLLVLWLYISLYKLFPGKDIIQISTEVFGKWMGSAISLLYIFFFITLAALNLRDLANFVRYSIMVDMPMIVISVAFVLVCSWAVRHGLEVLLRPAGIFVALSMAIMTVSVLLTLNIMDFGNFLPVLQRPPLAYLHGIQLMLNIPLGECVIFFMIFPNVTQQKKIGKMFFWGLVVGVGTLLTMVVRDTAVLGSAAATLVLPSYETLRMVNLGQALNRIDILFAVVRIILIFYKVSLLQYVSVKSIARVTNMSGSRPLVLAVGALIVSYCIWIYPSQMEHAYSGQKAVPHLWMLLEIGLPLITFVVAKIKGVLQKHPSPNSSPA